jgi:hypothetical protein
MHASRGCRGGNQPQGTVQNYSSGRGYAPGRRQGAAEARACIGSPRRPASPPRGRLAEGARRTVGPLLGCRSDPMQTFQPVPTSCSNGVAFPRSAVTASCQAFPRRLDTPLDPWRAAALGCNGDTRDLLGREERVGITQVLLEDNGGGQRAAHALRPRSPPSLVVPPVKWSSRRHSRFPELCRPR